MTTYEIAKNLIVDSMIISQVSDSDPDALRQIAEHIWDIMISQNKKIGEYESVMVDQVVDALDSIGQIMKGSY